MLARLCIVAITARKRLMSAVQWSKPLKPVRPRNNHRHHSTRQKKLCNPSEPKCNPKPEQRSRVHRVYSLTAEMLFPPPIALPLQEHDSRA